MNKQSLRKTGLFQKEKGIIWTELVRWWLSFKKMQLRKNVDYQECFLKNDKV